MILDAAQAGGLFVCVGCVLICAWSAMRSRQKARDHDADLTRLWVWALQVGVWLEATDRHLYDAPPRPTPYPRVLEEEPPTVVSHPADTYARQASLLARYTHEGGHRG